MRDVALDFITVHFGEDICVYYEPWNMLDMIRITMRRNTALVKRIVSYFDIDRMNEASFRELLDSMYNEFKS